MLPVVTVSPGSAVTPADLQAFHERWMNPGARASDISDLTRNFTQPYPRGAWGAGEDMGAMVRMFDLTHDRAYLDHLREMSRLVLGFRDDWRTDKPGRREPFHGRVMPAWGSSGVGSGYLHYASLDIAGVYSYPIAAFARIVAEHPDLWADYGADAISFADAILETLEAFADDLTGPREDPNSSYYVTPRAAASLLTEARCSRAHELALKGLGPDGWAVREDPPQFDNLKIWHRGCNDTRKGAGYPLPHNQNNALLMAMIEAWRAVDSAFYANRAGRNPRAEWARTFFPMQIKRTFHWFARNIHSPDGSAGRVSWHYADVLPREVKRHIEDTSHAELCLRYLGVLHRNSDRITRALPPGVEPIDLSALRRQLRRTFLERVGRGDDLAHNLDGAVGDDRYNHCCDGWLDLIGDDAHDDAWIYEKCHEITLRVVDGREVPQPYLLNSNHASLLANKPAGPPDQTVVPDVRDSSPARAAEALRAAGLVPTFTGQGTWVERQSPHGGAVVARGSTVSCGLRTGPVL